MKVFSAVLLLGTLVQESIASPPSYGNKPCPADKCFSAIRSKSSLASTASSFCKTYITRSTSTKTSTKTKTQTITVNPSVRTVISTIYATATSSVTTTPAQAIITSSVTATATATATATSTPPQNTVTVTTVETTIVATQTSACSTVTTNAALPTFVDYPGLPSDSVQKRDIEERNDRRIPKELSEPNCGSGSALASKVKSACSCYLGPAYKTVTSTKTVQTTVTAPAAYGYGPRRATTVSSTITQATVTSTVTATAPADSTVTTIVATNTITSTVAADTPRDATVTATSLESSTSIECSTSTVTNYNGVCGTTSVTATAYGTGFYTCTSATQPSATAARFRIEASDNEGTLWEGCLTSTPRDITTPSGGTHRCAVNNGATLTTQIDESGKINGFTYDGSFSPSFNDYFITRIGSTQRSGNSYWGVLNGGVFTTSGGCGAPVDPGQEGLWQWDAFSLNSLLRLSYDYAIVRPGDTVTLQVRQRSPNGGGDSAASGASIAGATSNDEGNVSFTAPLAEGCYQYKATRSGSGRSQALYLTVVKNLGN